MHQELSLSHYFPPDTHYFYGYPSDPRSGFLTKASVMGHELAATKPLVCAGDTRVICYATGAREDALRVLRDEIGLSVSSGDQILRLPAEIDLLPIGSARDEAIQRALLEKVPDGKLVMAQPYRGKTLNAKYLIPSETTLKLNDKDKLSEVIPSEYLLADLHRFQSGLEFSSFDPRTCELPCVVKITNGSGGDGVYICKTIEDLKSAQENSKAVPNTIIIQEYIEDGHDIDIQFGIPYDNRPPEILGFSSQLTTKDGKYLGGEFDDTKTDASIREIYKLLEENVLPKIREKGWFGVGGFDLLIRPDGRFVFIDGNLRKTATHVYRFHINNGLVQNPLVTFSGTLEGNLDTFKARLVPLGSLGSTRRIMHPVSLFQDKGLVSFNAGVLYTNPQDLRENAQELIRQGVRSQILETLTQ